MRNKLMALLSLAILIGPGNIETGNECRLFNGYSANAYTSDNHFISSTENDGVSAKKSKTSKSKKSKKSKKAPKGEESQ